MRRTTLIACAVIVLILAALAAKSVLIAPPPLHDAAGGFDAARAKARLAFILGDQRPHPADSAGARPLDGASPALVRDDEFGRGIRGCGR